MQALNVRKVEQLVNPELVNTQLTSANGNNMEEIKQQNAIDLKKKQIFNRFLEANCDCV